MATWSEVVALRNSGADSQTAESLLGELVDAGDLDARIQLQLLKLDARVRASELTPCEAFAEALTAIANAVQASTEGRDMLGDVRSTPWSDSALRARFLAYAWAYLVEPEDRSTWAGRLASFLTADERVEMSGLFQHTPAGAWTDVAPDWTARHADGGAGSGYLRVRADDPVTDEGGRKAHFLANAQFGFRYGAVGRIASPLSWEDSTTDKEVNAIGVEFGRAVHAGGLSPDDIAPWVKGKLCREGKCAEGRVSEDLLKKLEHGVIMGEVTYAARQLDSMSRTGSRPTHRRTVDAHTQEMVVVARVRLQPGAREAEFGAVVEGKWSATSSHKETGAADREQSGTGEIASVRGALVVDGEDAGSYWISVEGAAPTDDSTITSYSFGAGEGRRLCADGTLSGSIVRKTSHSKDAHYEDPRDMGEMLRGGGIPYVETRVHDFESTLNWKFTFDTAVPPPHLAFCGKRYDYAGLMETVTAFFTGASTRLAVVGSRMAVSGRITEAQQMMGLFGTISTAMGPAASSLSSRTYAIEDGCRELELLWTGGDDAKYQQALQELKANVEAWKTGRRDFVDLLVTEGERIVDGVRQEDADAAADIDQLLNNLRRSYL